MTKANLNIQCIDTRQGNVGSLLAALREKLSPRGDVVSESGRQRTLDVFGAPLTPQQVVQRILAEVQSEGTEALLRYTAKLDGAELTPETLQVSVDELQQAHAQADRAFLETVRRIRDNIYEFQTAILHQDVEVTRDVGVTLRQRYVPLRRIGVCVPGGAAAYPSTVLMTVVPALAAGVEQIAVVAPPTTFGAYNLDLLATCHELGVTEVYRIGGAQAVAALAYGVAEIERVDKIVGPGNLFVALAKKFAYGDVDIDSIAGPSEVVVLADHQASAAVVASELLAQAEHAPGASVLITWEDGVQEAVLAELNAQVARLSRCELTVQSLEEFGALIRVEDRDEACQLTDSIAPEHLQIAAADADQLGQKIRNAGATFLGAFTPVALGDYFAGPSHVLPTGGTARWASGLSANDFLRSGSVVHFTADALRDASDSVQLMAEKEGLTAHRASVEIRIQK